MISGWSGGASSILQVQNSVATDRTCSKPFKSLATHTRTAGHLETSGWSTRAKGMLRFPCFTDKPAGTSFNSTSWLIIQNDRCYSGLEWALTANLKTRPSSYRLFLTLSKKSTIRRGSGSGFNLQLLLRLLLYAHDSFCICNSEPEIDRLTCSVEIF